MAIMFVPVGEQIKPIYEGFKYVKNIEKVYLIASNKTERYAHDIKKRIEYIYDTEIVLVDPEKLDDIMEKLIDVVSENKDREIISNITGGTKVMSHACYILCSYLGGDAFYIFKRDDGSMEYVDMPMLKIKLNSVIEDRSTRERILEKLMESEYDSMTSLARELRIKDSTLSVILDQLKEQGLVILERSGRNLRIKISKTGKILLRLRKLKK
ncbi:MAG: hypothetical protein DRO95_04715 [Candidatus Altiarchaeales archaeon]|nr:MAG: hypothetical protein DRO95_04715 [Candidatus Altiarchaeales archaeon]